MIYFLQSQTFGAIGEEFIFVGCQWQTWMNTFVFYALITRIYTWIKYYSVTRNRILIFNSHHSASTRVQSSAVHDTPPERQSNVSNIQYPAVDYAWVFAIRNRTLVHCSLWLILFFYHCYIDKIIICPQRAKTCLEYSRLSLCHGKYLFYYEVTKSKVLLTVS